MWWQWASQMTDWCGGRGQVKWLTDAVTLCLALALTDWCGGSGQANDWVKWLTDVVAGGKSNDWLMWWWGQVRWLTDVVGASQMTDQCGNVVVEGKSNDWLMWWQWASQMTDWCGGRGQVKWMMRWYGNALCLVLALALSLVLALALALTDDVVAVGKSNDWLMWWQGASQMTDWCSGTIML